MFLAISLPMGKGRLEEAIMSFISAVEREDISIRTYSGLAINSLPSV